MGNSVDRRNKIRDLVAVMLCDGGNVSGRRLDYVSIGREPVVFVSGVLYILVNPI